MARRITPKFHTPYYRYWAATHDISKRFVDRIQSAVWFSKDEWYANAIARQIVSQQLESALGEALSQLPKAEADAIVRRLVTRLKDAEQKMREGAKEKVA